MTLDITDSWSPCPAPGGPLLHHHTPLRSEAPLNELLIEIEQLELLATTNPSAALQRLDRELSHDEPISIAAGRAVDDYRWGHMLADLLIEELFQIDADVIRRMVRGRHVF